MDITWTQTRGDETFAFNRMSSVRAKKTSRRIVHVSTRKKGFVIPTKSFVKIEITKIFCYNNKMFSYITKTFGCCSKIFG